MKIPITPKRHLKVSVWAFEAPFLLEGQQAYITDVIVADAQNPLYKITRESDGETSLVYRSRLVEVGALEPIDA